MLWSTSTSLSSLSFTSSISPHYRSISCPHYTTLSTPPPKDQPTTTTASTQAQSQSQSPAGSIPNDKSNNVNVTGAPEQVQTKSEDGQHQQEGQQQESQPKSRLPTYALLWVIGSFGIALLTESGNAIHRTREDLLSTANRMIDYLFSMSLKGELPFFMNTIMQNMFIQLLERIYDLRTDLQTEDNLCKLADTIQFLCSRYKEEIDNITEHFLNNEQDHTVDQNGVHYGIIYECSLLITTLSQGFKDKNGEVIKKMASVAISPDTPYPVRISMARSLSIMAEEEENRQHLLEAGATSLFYFYYINKNIYKHDYNLAIQYMLQHLQSQASSPTSKNDINSVIDQLKTTTDEDKKLIKYLVKQPNFPIGPLGMFTLKYYVQLIDVATVFLYSGIRGMSLSTALLTTATVAPVSIAFDPLGKQYNIALSRLESQSSRILFKGVVFSTLFVPMALANRFVPFWKGSLVAPAFILLYQLFLSGNFNIKSSNEMYRSPPSVDITKLDI
ncbi:hypothetical protein SAMD00019534_112410 [Acytostelium subglobosum LB1]|uniref:hypothetical protein n=1 Tax=Acytostelium subglobosum LB1 TaxID=1410327 RepID=UPI000644C472|nr:hypothetical protein SAMD00019534_112410 [Acytostelium subglobosum LB1]GAM28065.1 hypothetical protein SAMD00019534_112410 [Acytostelium subglobosum LB1]|eukprot:XP_012749024.1 hypothetical protein SAMD00019534_112410 [Acytostelium subglobosum LB1]